MPLPKSMRWWIGLVALLGGAVAAGLWWWNRPASVEIPAPTEMASLDAALQARLEQAQQAVRDDPGSADAWAALATTYHANGMPELAVRCYRQALDLAPDRARWWYWMGLCHDQLSQRAESSAAFEQATKHDGSYPPAFWRWGLALLEQGETERAEAAFRRAQSIDPVDPVGTWGLARCLLQTDRATEAASVIRTHLQRFPQDAYGHHLLGTALRQMGELEPAARHLALGRGANPTYLDTWSTEVNRLAESPGALLREGLHWMNQREYRQALRVWTTLLRRWPEDVVVLNNLAQAYLELGMMNDVLRTVQMTQQAHPDHAQSYLVLANAMLRARQWDQALAQVEASLERDSRSASAWETRGLIHVSLQQPTKAVEDFQKAQSLDPAEPRYPYQIAMVHCRAKRWNEGERILASVVRDFPSFVPGLVGMALAQMEQGKFDAARSALEQARQWGSDDPSIRFAVERWQQLQTSGDRP